MYIFMKRKKLVSLCRSSTLVNREDHERGSALDASDDFSGILTLNFAHLSRSSDACWDDNEAVKSSVHRLSTHGVWAARDEKEGKEDRRKRERRKWKQNGAKSEKESRTNPWHTRGGKSGATESPGGTRKHVHTRQKRRRRVT